MMATVSPGQTRGTLAAPPSKSYTHRALLAGHFAGRTFRVEGPLISDDTRATRDALPALGTQVRSARDTWILSPESSPRASRRVRTIRCGESGTTLRFTTAAAAVLDRPIRFVGHERLAARPMAGLVTALSARGANVSTPAHRALPMIVHGPMSPGRFVVDGSVSSQFISALLLALPGLAAASTLTVRGHRVSEPYVDATVAVLRAHGVHLEGRSGRWTVPAPQSITGARFRVPGDASSAAYLWAAGAITGGLVTVTGVPPEWPQADRRILQILRSAGAVVRERGATASVSGSLTTPFRVNLTDAPDLYPLVGVLAALTPGRSTISGAAHVVFKESDRKAGMMRLVRALGGHVRPRPKGVEIQGTDAPRPVHLKGLSDHRLVMSAAVGALSAGGPSTLDDAGAVAKSFPGFWSALRSLGGEVSLGV